MNLDPAAPSAAHEDPDQWLGPHLIKHLKPDCCCAVCEVLREYCGEMDAISPAAPSAANEREMFRRLSDALTGGNAATWEEVIHAAEQARVHETGHVHNAVNLAAPSAAPPREDDGLIPLNDEQLQAVNEWAADDRLWTTQDTVEINLRTFARVMLKLASSPSAAPREAREPMAARMSTLDDAAFHFQTCRTCRKVGDEECPDGSRFAAFLRGESDGD